MVDHGALVPKQIETTQFCSFYTQRQTSNNPSHGTLFSYTVWWSPLLIQLTFWWFYLGLYRHSLFFFFFFIFLFVSIQKKLFSLYTSSFKPFPLSSKPFLRSILLNVVPLIPRLVQQMVKHNASNLINKSRSHLSIVGIWYRKRCYCYCVDGGDLAD